MQIKFNKLKPTAKSDEQKPASPVQQSAAQNPVPPQQPTAPKLEELTIPPKAEEPKAAPSAPAPTVAPVQAPAAPAPVAPAPAAAPVQTASTTEPAPAPAPAEVSASPAPVAPAIVPVESKPMGVRIEDTLKQFLNKPVRVYMADHEYVSGRLDIVEDGWIKICNARSAGSDYYFDEDIINTVNVVRVRVSVNVGKEKYVEFMAEANK